MFGLHGKTPANVAEIVHMLQGRKGPHPTVLIKYSVPPFTKQQLPLAEMHAGGDLFNQTHSHAVNHCDATPLLLCLTTSLFVQFPAYLMTL
jgi:hypothetical protein